MSGQIFISYRREESRWSARSLHDRLSVSFGPKQIFMDIDAIAPGEDFVRAIETTVAKCDVLIAVIGNNWLTSKDDRGGRRLDSPEDFVRMEIATALKREIRVIPVLVDGAGGNPPGLVGTPGDNSPGFGGSTTGPPQGATAVCRDGNYSFSTHHTGTCSGHGGVKQWLGN